MLILALARTPGTQLYAALTGDTWTPEMHLLAAAVDVLAAANWQRGGGKGSRPTPISPSAKKPETPGRVGKADGLDQREILAVLAANAGR